MDRVASAGVNTYKCPVCKDTLFVALDLANYSKMRAYGAISWKARCQSGHTVDLNLRRTKQPDWNSDDS